METNEKGDISPQSAIQCKGTTSSLKKQVLSLLKSDKYTAVELNQMLFFNDSRKVISDLRSDGYLIADYRLPDNRKVYFLRESPQLELFKEGGEL